MKKKIASVIVLLIIWQLVIYFSANNFFPSPLDVINAFIYNFSSREIFFHIFSSLQRVMLGFLAACFLGISLAIFFGYNNKYGSFLSSLIELFRPIPPIAWIPIAIIVFGLGDMSAYFIVFLGAFFPIFTSTYSGVTSMPEIYKNVANSFEIKKMVYLKNILFPYSLPHIFTGLKIGMGMAWMSVIAAELIGAQSGLGYFIQLNRLLLRMDNVVLGMILIGLIGFLLSKIILLIEKTMTPWIKR